jgi:hypothetical protein
MPTFIRALHQKIRNCATMLSSRLCPMHVTGLNWRDFASSACEAQQRSGSSGGIVSSFRFICIAALIAAVVGFVAGAAAAQSAPATDQSGKPYLAGLHPPHEHHKPAHSQTSRVSVQHKPTTKPARTETRRRPTVVAKVHRPARLADKINSRVAWPNAEPAAADERANSETVLQFATEDAGPAPAAAARPMTSVPTTPTAKPAPPAKIAATDERNNGDSAADKPPAASTPVQTERFEAPASSQMRVILPVPSEAPVAAPAPKDQAPTRGSSSTAQLLATLAGAITAGIVGWLMIGFGSIRTIKSRQT